ncbi:MAG: hypothetical protein OXI54_09335 [Chloroflexota bacterium]|nr:hypothetical protein [Chloroflexota bacterium]MDE2684339.1 hypothetical protein [Chloroflexota bacterium]
MTTPLLAAAYVDTTALTPLIAGEEPVTTSIRRKLESFRYLLSANLLEAEMRVVFALEGREFDDAVLSSIRWIMPNRRLDAEMATVLRVAQLEPIRLWHLATALFFAELVPDLVFVTLDEQQETAARDLGLALA